MTLRRPNCGDRSIEGAGRLSIGAENAKGLHTHIAREYSSLACALDLRKANQGYYTELPEREEGARVEWSDGFDPADESGFHQDTLRLLPGAGRVRTYMA